MQKISELYREYGYSTLLDVSPAPLLKPVEELTENELFDEYGELDNLYRLSKPLLIDRRESLRARINGLAAAYPANQPVLFSGDRYQLNLSARRQEFDWASKLKLWRKLGGLKSIELWSVTFKNVAGVLGEALARTYQVAEQTGYRTIEAVRKRPVEQETGTGSTSRKQQRVAAA